MSNASQTLTSDLRTPSLMAKRDAEYKAKWSRGSVAPSNGSGKARPLKRSTLSERMMRRKIDLPCNTRTRAAATKLHNHWLADNDASGASSEESFEEDEQGDVGVAFSFDAPRGPTEGSGVLLAALERAENRWEERETERVVKSEYEVLDEGGEVVVQSPLRGKRGRPLVGWMDEGEDYEFV